MIKDKASKIISVLIVLSLAAGLCSCTVADYISGAVGRLTSTEEDSGNTAAEETAEAETKEISNDITVGVIDYDTFNPLWTASQTVRDVCGFIYEPLFGIDSTMRTTGVLADSYIIGADGASITINLKQGVMWHDGTEFNADDVIYTVNTIKEGNTLYTAFMEPVTGIWKNDNYTVCVTFSRSVPDSVSLFTFPIVKNKSLYSGKKDFIPVGTGPFRYVYSGGTAYLEAFEEHHDGRAKLDRVNIEFLSDLGKYRSLFNANELDMADSEMLDMSTFMPKSNSNVTDYTSNTMVFAGFNTSNPKLSGARTRQAISLLIDRDAIATNIYYSRAVASDYAINPQSWLSFETRTKLRADAWSATQLLAQDGWTADSRGIYYKQIGGKLTYLTLTILVNSDSEQRVAVADQLAQWLNNNGIIAKVNSCDYTQFNAMIAAHNYDMFVGETELLPNNDMTNLAGSAGNYFNYANTEMDTLLWQLGTVQLESDVQSVSNRLYELIHTEVPFAPICFLKKSLVTGAKIKSGFNPSIQGFVRETENWSVN
ncbi:MAG: ABC transporter substrate-binding protein [Candidatus Ornithomonoglobus sp.]